MYNRSNRSNRLTKLNRSNLAEGQQLKNTPPPCFPDQENQAPATLRNPLRNHYFFNCSCSVKLDLLNLVNLLDLLYILETYLL